MTLEKFFFCGDLWFQAEDYNHILIAWNKNNQGFRVTYRDFKKVTRFVLQCEEQDLITEIKKKINIELTLEKTNT